MKRETVSPYPEGIVNMGAVAAAIIIQISVLGMCFALCGVGRTGNSADNFLVSERFGLIGLMLAVISLGPWVYRNLRGRPESIYSGALVITHGWWPRIRTNLDREGLIQRMESPERELDALRCAIAVHMSRMGGRGYAVRSVGAARNECALILRVFAEVALESVGKTHDEQHQLWLDRLEAARQRALGQ